MHVPTIRAGTPSAKLTIWWGWAPWRGCPWWWRAPGGWHTWARGTQTDKQRYQVRHNTTQPQNHMPDQYYVRLGDIQAMVCRCSISVSNAGLNLPSTPKPVCLNLQAASATAPAAVACVCPLQLLATSNPQEDHPWRLHRSATQLLRHSISTAQHSTRTTTAQHKGPYLVAGEVVGAAPGRSAPGPCPPCGGHGHRGGHGQGAPALGGSWVGLSARRCARAGTSHQACSHPFLHTPTQTSQTVSAC